MSKQTLMYRVALAAFFAIGMVACNDDENSVPPAPAIASVSLSEALPGNEVIIKGSNLAFATAVVFREMEAEVEYNTNSNIITHVPANAAAGTQQIKVTTRGGSATYPFTVLEVPVEPNLSFTADKTFLISGFGEEVLLTAEVDEPVSCVVFFEGDTELGQVTDAPFTWSYAVGDAVAAYTNVVLTARVYGEGNSKLESSDVTIRVGKRVPVSDGTLTGNGEEVWNTDGPKEPPFPSDGIYAGFLNFDGAGDLEAASGVNVPVTVPEAGQYFVSLGLASGWADAESFMRFYFNQDVANNQRSPEVSPTGWIDFNNYMLENPFELTAGDHMAKIRFGAPFVHPYYVDLFKF